MPPNDDWSQAAIEALLVLAEAGNAQAALMLLHRHQQCGKELYAILERLQPSPVVRTNRAVALLKCGRREQALELLESLSEHGTLEGYLPFHVARGATLLELQRGAEALLAYQRARELADNAATIRHLEGRIREISGGE